MALPNSSRLTKGFTLVEAIIVMAFIALIGGFTLFVSMDSFSASNFHTERDVVIATLQHARAQAVANVCLGGGCTTGKSHGVAIQSNKSVIFQGTSYAARDAAQDANVDANSVVTRTCVPATCEFVFSELSGNATPGTITLSGGGRTSTITITSVGRIYWDK